MSEKLPVSVHVLTWNSGTGLRKALESVKDAAELIVIDGGSTDDTLSIAREYGAKIIPQRDREQGTPLQNFAAARNRGLRCATQPWILSLDSDETASPELLHDIRSAIAAGIPCACLVPRRYILPDGRLVTHATTYPNERFYFFHRDAVIDWSKRVHESPTIQPGTPIKNFQGASLAPLGTFKEYREKNLRYIAIERDKSPHNGWKHWLRHRLWHTFRSRTIALIRLFWIWCLPHRNCVRLPLRHELLRFWYAWQLIVKTCPLMKKRVTSLRTSMFNLHHAIDRYYHLLRPYRFLYGWAKDRVTKARCNRRAEEWRAKGFRGAKLDICGGRNPWKPEEFLNVDIVDLPQVDCVFDVRKRFPIDDGVIAEIFSAATLEHFREQDNLHILREFFRILRPGGTLRISTPDLEAIAKGILEGADLHLINQHLFGKYKGSETEDYDLHRWMYPAPKMMETLACIGFTDIERIPNTTGLHDPHYNYLIRARKPELA